MTQSFQVVDAAGTDHGPKSGPQAGCLAPGRNIHLPVQDIGDNLQPEVRLGESSGSDNLLHLDTDFSQNITEALEAKCDTLHQGPAEMGGAMPEHFEAAVQAAPVVSPVELPW